MPWFEFQEPVPISLSTGFPFHPSVSMSAANHLEVVQTEEGVVVLRRTDSTSGSAEPLVSLRFSPEVRDMLGEHLNEVALVMLGAGMQATSQIASTPAGEDHNEPRTLH